MLYASAKCPKCGVLLGKVHQYNIGTKTVPSYRAVHRGMGFEVDEEDGESHVTQTCYHCGQKCRLQRRGATFVLIWEDGVKLIED